MKLQGRSLELNLRGDDVALLHAELRQLNIQITDPPGFFGSTTLLAVQRFQSDHRLSVTGVVDARTARLINQAVDALPRQTWRVQGQVLRPDGQAVANARMRVFEKRLRRDAVLGEGVTDATGAYGIDYPIPSGGDISLYVHALSASGERLAASEVVCHAKPVETIDLAVGEGAVRGRPLFARLQAALQPLLAPERVAPADLSTDDVHWLACRHALDEAQLTHFANAARLARDAELPREHEAIFGLLMQNLPSVLEALISTETNSLRLALEQSVADNLVDVALAARLDQIIRALHGVVIRLALREPAPNQATFSRVFDLAGIANESRASILRDHLQHTGTLDEFWDAQTRRLGRDAVDELQQVIRLSALCLNHEPMLSQLMRMRSAGEAGPAIESLARLTRNDWLGLIRQRAGSGRIGAPAFLAADEAARDNLFATYMVRYVEAQAPTRVLAERLAIDTPQALTPGLAFLRRHPGFDFRRDRVGDFLRANPNALEGDADPAATRTAMLAMQRLFDMAPPFDKHQTIRLLGQGIESATQIRRIGKRAFVARTAEALGGEATARAVYAKAALKADTALLFLTQTAYANGVSVQAVPPQIVGPGVADLEDLFGSLDACRCLHCASVYSPAAYLVDLLHFLMNLGSTVQGSSALDVLFARRPDIGVVDLNCDNTHTTLPYVDLVVEILEHAVAGGGGFPFQTEGDSADLLASPAHVNPVAYDASHLAGAIYPWSLPFDLWTEVARSYLQHLGVLRHELMAQLRGSGDSARPADVAAECLGLTSVDRSALSLITLTERRRQWGFPTGGSAAPFNEFVQSRNVGAVLERSRLTYDELVAVLDVRYVDRSQNLRIEFDGANCNVDTATLINLEATVLDRLHRFMRLQRRSAWSIAELGALMQTLQTPQLINDEALIRLADAKRVQQILRAPLDVVLGWWDLIIDTLGIGNRASLYDQVFQDPSASRPVADVLRLNADRTELAQANTALISANLPTVHAALGISASDLDQLRSELLNDRLNLQNLTRLNAIASLAKAVGIKVSDFLALRALTGLDPVGPAAAPAITLQFVETARRVASTPHSLALLDYLLRHRFAANAPFAVADEEIAARLETLRSALRAVQMEFALAAPGIDTDAADFEADPAGTRTAAQLAALLPADVAARALSLVRLDTLDPPLAPEVWVEQQSALIQTHLATFMDADEAIDRLVAPGTITNPRQRFNYVLARLLAYRRPVERETQTVIVLAQALDIDEALASALLRDLVRSPAEPLQPVISDLASAEFAGDLVAPPQAVSRPAFPDQFAAYERLHKLVRAAAPLGLDIEQLRFTLAQGPERGWLDLASLPLAAVDQAQPAFEAFLNLSTALRAGAALPGGLADFFALLRRLDEPDMNAADYLNEVALRTGWDRASIEFIAGDSLLRLNWPQGFRSGIYLAEMSVRMDILRRLGVAAQTAQSWASQTVSADAAQAIVQTARSKHADKTNWLEVARPLRDPLRERQRSALVDYLLHQHGLQSPSQLYAHYLVDVEMSPCMLTSRLVLATASVQLFIQRCLLDLEAQVPPEEVDTQQWDWMKNYRVWEANRKVFLYPENWIEPELRDDKSEIFKTLEQGLLQGEMTGDLVEREYMKYLQSLDQLSNLEIAGMRFGDWGERKDVLHVFGRSHNPPRTYYYRRWNQGAWSSWESVDAGVEGDHLMPVTWNGRLNLLWPVFADETQEISTPSDSGDPATSLGRYQSVRIARSEYRQGRWTPKTLSDVKVNIGTRSINDPNTVAFPTVYSPSAMSFWTPSTLQTALTVTFDVHGATLDADGLVFNAAGKIIKTVEPLNLSTGPAFPNLAHAFNHQSRAGVGSRVLQVLTKRGATPATSGPVTLLHRAQAPFEIVFEHHRRPYSCQTPFFYQDPQHCMFVVPNGRYLTAPGIGSPMVDDRATTPSPSQTNQGSIPALNLADRVTAFHAQAVNSSAAGEVEVSASHHYMGGAWQATSFRFHSHDHPWAPLLIEQLNRFGVSGVLKPTKSMEPALAGAFGTLRRQSLFRPFFWSVYGPNQPVSEPVVENRPVEDGELGKPLDEFDFSFGGAYSLYNWELFFHVPLLIAKRLSVNRRFAQAHRWFGFIFDPTNSEPPSNGPSLSQVERAWNIKPFVEHGRGRSIRRLMLLLRTSGLSDADLAMKRELNDEIEAWRANPFNTHMISRMRVQPYMMAVVMAYLDNLIAWADDLFRTDSMESINEASQLYVLAAEILGERPREIGNQNLTRRTIDGQIVTNFNDLRAHLDGFSNALVSLENIILPGQGDTGAGGTGGLLQPADTFAAAMPDAGPALDLDFTARIPALVGPTLFFCIPPNDVLVNYWDVVADRLFKIRHCMNIEGVVRQLPLFQAPIDPGLLVRAAAAGIDIAGALQGSTGPMPSVRFATLLQQARDAASEVRSLGAGLLAAMEKRDSEQLALLRSSHEATLLQSMLSIKSAQKEQLIQETAALRKSRAVAQNRFEHLSSLLTPRGERGILSEGERESLGLLVAASQAEEDAASARETAANLARLLPEIGIGWAGLGPYASASVGRGNFIALAEFGAVKASNEGAAAARNANQSSLMAGWDRRLEQWKHEQTQAELELEHLDKAIIASEMRIAISEHELQTHHKQMEQAEETEAYLRSKFSSTDLYGWMVSRISAVHFQAYQLALELAKRAERAYRFELGRPDSAFVALGQFDSLRKGLLAGESLTLDLLRMGSSYMELNRREYELTKHVSLRQLDPLALLTLKATGQCEFELPEWLFDLDGPGHFMRRIKTVSLSLPCVVGPHVSVNCTARLLRSQVRTAALASGTYARTDTEDPRFATSLGTVESTVTSGASNDNGMFETNLRDERYLPFEGNGAIGRWRLELPAEFRQFDYMTIADAILHMRYTARDGGASLRQAAVGHLGGLLQATDNVLLTHLVSLRQDFPGEWQRFVAGEDLVLTLDRGHFPYIAQGRTIEVRAVDAWAPGMNAQAPTSLSEGQMGLDAFPSMPPGQTDPFELRMFEPVAPITRTPEVHGFLLVRYVVR